MQLVITEKPSVARAIAAVIGAPKKQNGYLEGGGYIVSWCVGHLVELADAAAYDPAYAKWRRETLPILPNPWQYAICESTSPQFHILKRLMNESRVDGIICATDAGREGELIFRLVYQMAGCQKPVHRLWISSMEESAIREGFRSLKPIAQYDNLYKAALCRAQADWLVGINATRLFSLLYGQTLNVGRVMSPTLGMIVQREAQIAVFQPQPFYAVQLDCGALTAASERITDRAEADRIAALCDGREARIVSLTTKERKEQPPKLYDLTTLQRDANRLLGYTAQQTLDYAQSLYEKKLCTYPRTDSRYLTSAQEEVVGSLLKSIAKQLPFSVPPASACVFHQVINDEKVTDHHAILPTLTARRANMDMLPIGEKNILTMLMVRLLCAVEHPCRINETNVALECEGIPFQTKGKQLIEMGWKETESAWLASISKSKATKEQRPLPALNEHMSFLPVSAEIVEGTTEPPKHFTEDLLLSAMEHAAAKEAPEDTERKGLGTPATRAATIEKLVNVGLVQRKGSKKSVFLLPTEKGTALITVLPEELQSASLTAEWEQKLKQIEHGKSSMDVFMAEITEMVRRLVADAKPIPNAHALFADDKSSLGLCPRCGSAITENRKGFCCQNKACCFALWKQDRFFTSKRKELTAAIVSALLKDGRVSMRGLFSEKTGKIYNATIVLDDSGDGYVHYKMEFEGGTK